MIHLSAFFAIYVKFFFIMTPFFVTTIFLSVTKGIDESDKRRLAIKVTLAIAISCLIILFFGKYIFELFGITLDAFRIGAGALLFLTAVDLVQKDVNAEPTCKADILKHAVVPLAIPVTVGPGTVGALMVMGADMDGLEDLILGSSALLGAILSIGVLLYLSGHIERLIGRTGLIVFSKVTGLVLSALSAQLIFTGIKNFLH
ncbi:MULTISPECIES: MarC family protein [unclassified Sulfurospirillum]|uniref:MarC family protein n=1 Tax=unclassified Sulfurospirillum TaxID=2618290 RepID=UPI000502645A|nr:MULTISPECIES: MarC family protein [unclassified Sulfurospirillum]KFL35285.1 membrane protein [Sulfurospirillum sp. SCADC]